MPLLLCNGIGTGLQLFDPLVEHLDPGRPVIGFDPPGIGGSAARRYRFATLASAVRGVVAELGHGRVDVLGLSWGGALAQQYALQNPRHCRRLVLAATGTGSVMVPAAPRTLRHLLDPRRHRDPAHARAIAGEVWGGAARRDPDAAVAALHRGPTVVDPQAYRHQLTALAGWSSLAVLPLIRQRTLILAGDDDPIVPAVNATLMARLLPHARVHRYAGGHLELLTGAAGLAPVIEQFLDAA